MWRNVVPFYREIESNEEEFGQSVSQFDILLDVLKPTIFNLFILKHIDSRKKEIEFKSITGQITGQFTARTPGRTPVTVTVFSENAPLSHMLNRTRICMSYVSLLLFYSQTHAHTFKYVTLQEYACVQHPYSVLVRPFI